MSCSSRAIFARYSFAQLSLLVSNKWLICRFINFFKIEFVFLQVDSYHGERLTAMILIYLQIRKCKNRNFKKPQYWLFRMEEGIGNSTGDSFTQRPYIRLTSQLRNVTREAGKEMRMRCEAMGTPPITFRLQSLNFTLKCIKANSKPRIRFTCVIKWQFEKFSERDFTDGWVRSRPMD